MHNSRTHRPLLARDPPFFSASLDIGVGSSRCSCLVILNERDAHRVCALFARMSSKISIIRKTIRNVIFIQNVVPLIQFHQFQISCNILFFCVWVIPNNRPGSFASIFWNNYHSCFLMQASFSRCKLLAKYTNILDFRLCVATYGNNTYIPDTKTHTLYFHHPHSSIFIFLANSKQNFVTQG